MSDTQTAEMACTIGTLASFVPGLSLASLACLPQTLMGLNSQGQAGGQQRVVYRNTAKTVVQNHFYVTDKDGNWQESSGPPPVAEARPPAPVASLPHDEPSSTLGWYKVGGQWVNTRFMIIRGPNTNPAPSVSNDVKPVAKPTADKAASPAQEVVPPKKPDQILKRWNPDEQIASAKEGLAEAIKKK